MCYISYIWRDQQQTKSWTSHHANYKMCPVYLKYDSNSNTIVMNKYHKPCIQWTRVWTIQPPCIQTLCLCIRCIILPEIHDASYVIWEEILETKKENLRDNHIGYYSNWPLLDCLILQMILERTITLKYNKIFLKKKKSPWVRVELSTFGYLIHCTTDITKQNTYYLKL